MTPGEAAYAVYRETRVALTTGNAEHHAAVAAYMQQETPEWEKLREDSKQAWEQIAQAAIEEYKRQNVVVDGPTG